MSISEPFIRRPIATALLMLGVLVFGILAADTGTHKDLGKPWLTAAMTLFVVALALLVMIIRDQRAAIRAVEASARADTAAGDAGADPAAAAQGGGATTAAHVASVERGRIAAMGGVVNLIWLVILVLMVWNG